MVFSRFFKAADWFIFWAFVLAGFLLALGVLFNDSTFVVMSVIGGWCLTVIAPIAFSVQALARLVFPLQYDWRSVGLLNYGFSFSVFIVGSLTDGVHYGWSITAIITGGTIGWLFSIYIRGDSRWICLLLVFLPVLTFVPSFIKMAPYILLCTSAIYITAFIHGLKHNWRNMID